MSKICICTGLAGDGLNRCPVHDAVQPDTTSKRVMLCTCGRVLESPAEYAEHCEAFPSHFTQS